MLLKVHLPITRGMQWDLEQQWTFIYIGEIVDVDHMHLTIVVYVGALVVQVHSIIARLHYEIRHQQDTR